MGGRQILWRSVFKASKNMASTSSPEGCFAITKPAGLSSAQVIRDVQHQFNPSKLFEPWITNEQARLQRESHNQKQKRRTRRLRGTPQLKMGHGGTLDPMATGVLILGVGSGTKSLGDFLGCTKSYETVVLFGKATDTYDTEGKVVASKGYEHITKEKVQEALAKFQGKIMQKPPIYSALKVNGKKMYEYAREGKELPIEIEERPVETEVLEMTEWMEGGTHQFHWPEEEAERATKVALNKALDLNADISPEPENVKVEEEDAAAGEKRKRQEEETVGGAVEPEGVPEPKRTKSEGELEATGALPEDTEPAAPATREPCPAPACRLRMTVTSGFYVRTLCHDLGAEVGSLGVMAELARTRQGDFELGKNVFAYEDLAKGEEHWAPQVRQMLDDWVPKPKSDRPVQREGGMHKQPPPSQKRRNSSSDEE